MGREIRKVPADWEHPKYTADDAPHLRRAGEFRPLCDQDYDSACDEWYAGIKDFKPREYAKYYHEEAGDPPDDDSYRKRRWTDEEATHFQVYETVSEGTPVTPHFATKEELVNYLAAHGDFWDQHRGDGPWSRKAAEKFVECEWSPSMTSVVKESCVVISEPRDETMYT